MKYFFIIIFFLGFMNIVLAQSNWTNYYFHDLDNSVNAIDTSNNGYFIVGGSSDQGITENYFAYKIDSSGNEVWNIFGNRCNGFDFQNYASCVVSTEDGGCLIGGIINVGSQRNLYFIRVDSSGHVLWDE